MAQYQWKRTGAGILAGVLLVASVLACRTSRGAPSVTITSPPSGSVVIVGQEVQIVSTAAADAGIARVDLLINGQVIRSDMPPSGNPSPFSIAQSWTPAAEGEVTVSVIAYDTAGASSAPAAILLRAVASTAASGVPMPTPEPSSTPVADVLGAGGCTLNASYVADVTVPDNTFFPPDTAFVKTWRIRNSGTCNWTTGFSLVFVGGDQMGGEAAVAVPPTAAGSTADVSVHLTAPAAPGTYRGNWRMQSDTGLAFGSQVYVQIIVPEPTPMATETPTAIPTVTPATPIPLPPIDLIPHFDPGIIVLAIPWTEEVYNQISVAAGNAGWVVASCPADTVVVGGGFAAGNNMVVYTHFKDGNGWRVYAKNYSGSSQSLGAYAICLHNVSGASVSQVTASISISPGASSYTIASCPAGSIVTGGGYASNPDTLWVYNSSMSGNGWAAFAQNLGGSNQMFNVYAICLSGISGATTQVVAQALISGGASGGVEVACPSGSIVTGGGFALNSDLVIYNTSMKLTDMTRWNSFARNNGSAGRQLNVYAICLSL